jgi:hypothetical protein
LAVACRVKTTKIVVAVGVLFAVYFPAASWLKYSYVPPQGPPGAISKLTYFGKFDDSGIAFISYLYKLRDIADTNDAADRSPVILYEDGKQLGPAHSVHADISTLGHGRFSHWKSATFAGFIFSASDNSDPSLNGREYWAAVPEH